MAGWVLSVSDVLRFIFTYIFYTPYTSQYWCMLNFSVYYTRPGICSINWLVVWLVGMRNIAQRRRRRLVDVFIVHCVQCRRFSISSSFAVLALALAFDRIPRASECDRLQSPRQSARALLCKASDIGVCDTKQNHILTRSYLLCVGGIL